MRNCVIECAREVLIHCLSKDGMEKKARDERLSFIKDIKTTKSKFLLRTYN